MIQIRPVNARTLVKPLPKEEVTIGSIILPDGGLGELEEAIAMSDFNIAGADGIITLVKAGEKIIYPPGGSLTQVVNGQHLKWVVITDIWGVVTEEETQLKAV
jgi:co-chaperonin GroES (HSP10)